jgi:hypothetical protein
MIAANPSTGRDEKVWAVFDGQDYEIHWAEKINGSWSNELSLTSNQATDACPVLSHFSDGSTAVVWREEGTSNRLLYRARKQVSGIWTWQSAAVEITATTSALSPPWILVHDSTPWVAWSEATGLDFEVIVSGGSGGGNPWPLGFTPSVLDTTTYSNAIGAEVSQDGTHLWVSWIHSGDEIGYSEWDAVSSTWSTPSYEEYSGTSDISDARERVRVLIKGG